MFLPQVEYVSYWDEADSHGMVYVLPGGIHSPIRLLCDVEKGSVTQVWVMTDLNGWDFPHWFTGSR